MKEKILTHTYISRIRNLREDHDKSQQEIADYLGTSQSMYARYERGANEIPVRHIIALCKYYHVSADYILGLSDIKQPINPIKKMTYDFKYHIP